MPGVKCVLLGEAATGKTTLASRFLKGAFSEFTESTIGAAILTKSIKLDDRAEAYRLELWDTAGQERFNSLAPMYYRAAKIILVCYDITSRDSYVRALEWIAQLQNDGPAGCVLCLAGLKADLASKREVPEQEASAFALDSANGVHVFMETSAKTGFNVDRLFESAVRRLPNDAPLLAPAPVTEIAAHVAREPKDDEASSGCCR